MATTINQINLESKRCIYVKISDTSSAIYFSNYYLKQEKDKQVVTPNTLADSFKFIFDSENFMNISLIKPENKLDKTKLNTRTNKNITKKIESLDMSLYSKLTYDDNIATAELDVTISEDIIKNIKVDDNPPNDNPIFTNKAQVRQFLKYDGLWINALPTKSDFNNRENTKMPIATAISVGGGKKTTTRRRGKASHNKHRKSNRRQ
jgi:hypothetical protein